MSEVAAPAPRANPDLLGHEAAERLLLAAWASERLPHGWLIAGPPGIGKATLAFRFARYVLAGGPRPDSLAVPENHPVFRRIAAGGHSDLVTLERAQGGDGEQRRTEIPVDAVRSANGFLRLTAGEGSWRVLIVDSADELNVNAANALLKILEEPPARALVLLVSHAPGGLPATVRSRCCRVVLSRLPASTVEVLLARHAPDLAAEERATLARLAEGSIGRALALREAGGLALYREILDLIAPMPRLDAVALHRFGERLARRNAEPAYRTATDLIQWWLARLVRIGATGQLAAGELVAGEEACARRLLDRAGLDQWAAVWEKVARSFAQTDGLNLDRKQAVLSAFFAIEAAARA
jgi:DNA polymerase-3 subunit delta'